MSYSQFITEDRRLATLRLLAEADGYALNTSILRDLLESACGHRVSRDRVDSDVDWLAEQSLVTAETIGPVRVVTITARGEDVARGRVTVSGVKRPGPGR